MSSFKVTVVDVSTGEEYERDATKEEIAYSVEYEKKMEEERLEAEKRKTKRFDLLNRLGITEEEAKILLS